MSAAQPALPGLALRTPTGDALGAVYTPESLALALVRHVAPRVPSRPTVLEPSVGGGAFVRAARRVLRPRWVIGVDVEPSAPGLALCDRAIVGDWPEVAAEECPRADVGLQNPPFGRAVGLDVTIAHIRALVECSTVAVSLLPLAYLCGAEFDAAIWQWRPPVEVVRITSRPWPDRLREAVALVWDSHDSGCRVSTLGWVRE